MSGRALLAAILLITCALVAIRVDLVPFDQLRTLAVRPRPAEASTLTEAGDVGAAFAELPRNYARIVDYQGTGALVVDVRPGGPADRKGLQEGDIVTRLDQWEVRTAVELAGRIRRMRPGSLASVEIYRDGSTRWLGLIQVEERRPDSLLEERVAALESQMQAARAEIAALRAAIAAPDTGGGV
jgi:S1-C subfamily serine protease